MKWTQYYGPYMTEFKWMRIKCFGHPFGFQKLEGVSSIGLYILITSFGCRYYVSVDCTRWNEIIKEPCEQKDGGGGRSRPSMDALDCILVTSTLCTAAVACIVCMLIISFRIKRRIALIKYRALNGKITTIVFIESPVDHRIFTRHLVVVFVCWWWWKFRRFSSA